MKINLPELTIPQIKRIYRFPNRWDKEPTPGQILIVKDTKVRKKIWIIITRNNRSSLKKKKKTIRLTDIRLLENKKSKQHFKYWRKFWTQNVYISKLSFKWEGTIKIHSFSYTRSQKACYTKTSIENSQYLEKSSQITRESKPGDMARYIHME